MTQTSQRSEPALPFRKDTFLGVCEAIGQDFGFHPNWLRVAFASVFLVSPAIVVSTYLGLGLVVAVSRYLAPDKTASAKLAASAPRLIAEQAEQVEERELIAA